MKGGSKMGKHKGFKNFFIYLGLILITFLTLFPLLWGISSSFRTDEELFKYALPFSYHTLVPVHFTTQAYAALFTKFNFLKPIINTLVVTIAAIFFSTLVNSIAAFSFATFEFKFKKILFGIVLVSFMIPFESIALPLYNVVDKFGWVDTYMGIIVPVVANGLVLFLFTQFFKTIPISLIEAARVDGAPWSVIFMKIIMPASVPVFVTAGLMIFMDQWNSYLWPLLIARSKDVQMIQIALSSFQQERKTLWSALYAGSMISALIPLFLFLPFQKYFVQGITSSGIKG
jgi:ABC-type glycerol-3-phosphate transport system permease component